MLIKSYSGKQPAQMPAIEKANYESGTPRQHIDMSGKVM